MVVIDQSGSMDACTANGGSRRRRGDPGHTQGRYRKERSPRRVWLTELRRVRRRQLQRERALGHPHRAAGQRRRCRVADRDHPAGRQTNISPGCPRRWLAEQTSATRRTSSSHGRWRQRRLRRPDPRMAAAGLTLSTVGAGGGRARLLGDLARRGGGRYYPATDRHRSPTFSSRDPAGSGQQIVEESFFRSSPRRRHLRGLRTGCRSARLNGHDIEAQPDGPRLDPATTLSWSSGSTASTVRGMDDDRRAAGGQLGRLGRVNRFLSQLVRGRYG